ncbi:MAG: TetR/AcrR family transcriptional regulator [Actinomycetota bacterium]|nr:TetR/AcrR family transcriptional regulator [Actinomycetota bacterium]
MARAGPTDGRVQVRRWGRETALADDDEARRRLIDAAGRCIVARGGVHFRMGEVADEAGVSRSTLYRYFESRDDLVMGLIISRVDTALEAARQSLPAPAHAADSLPELILQPLDLVAGNPLNEALFSPESGPVVTVLQLRSERLMDVICSYYGPLLEEWKLSGQLAPDLDVREALRWMNAISLMLLSPLA